jgi:hypothetical protein
MKKTEPISQAELIMEYFEKHPNRAIKHPEVVDWSVAEYHKRTGQVLRDPDRAIRKLAQEGRLIKLRKGIYKYDPGYEHTRELPEFTPEQKKSIFKRDGYKCVICGRGPANGVEIYADHIKPKEFGGESKIENGQTLCGQHHNLKQLLKQTETGKKMFIRLYELAKGQKDKTLIEFCAEVLTVFEKHRMNDHIRWKK